MSSNHHTFISAMLSFDDPTIRFTRFETDSFTAYLEIFELINKNFAQCMFLDLYVLIDKTLYPRVKLPPQLITKTN